MKRYHITSAALGTRAIEVESPEGGYVRHADVSEMAKDAARWRMFKSLDVDVYVNNFGMQWSGAGFAEGLQDLLDSLIADADVATGQHNKITKE